MSLNRVLILVRNEVVHGPKDVVLVMSIIMPVLLALFFNLAFGNIFTDHSKVGIFDEGNSRLPAIMSTADAFTLKTYSTEEALKTATSGGAIDMGIVLPANFDTSVASGTVRLKAYVWGESLAKNRTIIPMALADAVHEINNAAPPAVIETIALGDAPALPWNDRLLPLTILMAVFFGGMMIPASSLINEKNRRTLEALNVTPTTLGDIFAAKGIIGAVLATFMGMLTLAISGGFNASFPTLILVLGLGAVMAAEMGLMAGAIIKDMNTLFAFWKFGGLLLFGPAVVFMFPEIPQWVGYIFPTFYVIQPIVDVSVNGQSFSAIIPYLAILAGLVVVMAFAVRAIINRLSTRALRFNA